ncbi:hypothetical protein SRB5_46050 [Streptomyces sp. RB5]|uniref:DoxX family protein n=1 Tax=Streptomyces smaragdinus TaxID=2585196 RepID=A0A7K0CLS0_9ACTN|nr:DoxX family protein [Streptomyces smaragdinus]MQY14438.1 hypothetical protein [Streptomyces smaragdinus]
MRSETPAGLLGDLPDRGREHVIGLFRMVVALMFTCHGIATLFDVLGGSYSGTPDFAEWPTWWASVIQLVGGTLVFLGLGTRSAALVCSGSMAYAYFTKHQPDALFPIENGGEAAAMFCWSFLLVAALGPGRWALVGDRPARAATTPDRTTEQAPATPAP